MTLQELRFLVALAQEKHFGKAANLCHVSQPTLSIAIKKLEDELDVVLFERNKNDVRVTMLGQNMVERAQRILAEVEELKQVAAIDKDQLMGAFKLGAIYTIGPYLLPALITELNKLAPQMPIEIQEDYTANLKEKLSRGELDAVLVSLPFSVPGIVTRVLYQEPFVVLMPYDHPLASYKLVSEKMLGDYNILMLGEGHCFRDQVISSCPMCFASGVRHGVNWQTVSGSSLETIRHMVASKMGITILPITAANTGPYREKLLTIRPLKASSPHRAVVLAWRKSFPRIKAIDVLLKAVAKCRLEGVIKESEFNQLV